MLIELPGAPLPLLAHGVLVSGGMKERGSSLNLRVKATSVGLSVGASAQSMPAISAPRLMLTRKPNSGRSRCLRVR